MAEHKRDTIPEHFADIEEATEFWDTHDLADYADITEEVTATVDLQRRRYLVALAPDIATQLGAEARRQGVSAETLINLWLSERLKTATT
jgi:dihydroneopterin aldolase